MIKKVSRNTSRLKRHRRIRSRLAGTSTCPRLAVFRSNTNTYAQVIDDKTGVTLASFSTLSKDFSNDSKANTAAATIVGTKVAELAISAGIKKVVFDRGGYLYHGRVKAVAEAARVAGLEF
ncbi:50S ribosomal protein L18 [Erysipelotrichaceae bacterium]|nr:50S ribosomal protein L18 [Erysipelotrichaceae bacterium]